MIQSFEIANFRGFEILKGRGFGRINLIGGKNNIGKTSLLEALLLMCNPSNESIIRILGGRRVHSEYVKAIPEKAWYNLFFGQKEGNMISFCLQMDNSPAPYHIEITCADVVDDLLTISQEHTEQSEDDSMDMLTDKDYKKVVLHIQAKQADEQISSQSLAASAKGITGKPSTHPIIKAHLVLANGKLSGKELAENFDRADIAGYADFLLQAFRLIDKTISTIKTRSIGEPNVFVRLTDGSDMSINFFGDAINKIATYVLRIINNPNSVLLLDEVENGIHHESQAQVWKFLFELCEIHNVQIFATSHSGEMIKAFNDVVREYGFNGCYYKLSRHEASNRILMQKISNKVLANVILHNDPYRQ